MTRRKRRRRSSPLARADRRIRFANACAVREHAKVALVVVVQDIAGECRVLIDNDDLCGIDIYHS